MGNRNMRGPTRNVTVHAPRKGHKPGPGLSRAAQADDIATQAAPVQGAVPVPYKTYVDRAVGLNFGVYPKFIDECLDRAVVAMQVVTGTGNKTVLLDAIPSVVHASIVGVTSTKIKGAYQVTADIHLPEVLQAAKGNDVEGLTVPDPNLSLVVTASDGVSWSVLLLTQKGKQ